VIISEKKNVKDVAEEARSLPFFLTAHRNGRRKESLKENLALSVMVIDL